MRLNIVADRILQMGGFQHPLLLIRFGLRIGTLILLFLFSSNPLFTQTYWAFGNQFRYVIEVDDGLCDCNVELLGGFVEYGDGISFCPDGNFYTMSGPALLDVDLNTGNYSIVAIWPGGYTAVFSGIVCESDSTFYLLHYPDGILLLWNINSGIITELGQIGFSPLFHGFSVVDGAYYGVSLQGIFQVDINDPANSTLVVPSTVEFPYLFFHPTASNIVIH